jgi:hypothetical protein
MVKVRAQAGAKKSTEPEVDLEMSDKDGATNEPESDEIQETEGVELEECLPSEPVEKMSPEDMKRELDKAYEQRNLLWQWHLSIGRHPNIIGGAVRWDPALGEEQDNWPVLVGWLPDNGGEISFHVPVGEVRRSLRATLRASHKWDKSTWKRHKSKIEEFIRHNISCT